jgi:hypothetical protein
MLVINTHLLLCRMISPGTQAAAQRPRDAGRRTQTAPPRPLELAAADGRKLFRYNRRKPTDVERQGMNKRKRVALAKHRKKAKKSDEKRKLGALARRTK